MSVVEQTLAVLVHGFESTCPHNHCPVPNFISRILAYVIAGSTVGIVDRAFPLAGDIFKNPFCWPQTLHFLWQPVMYGIYCELTYSLVH